MPYTSIAGSPAHSLVVGGSPSSSRTPSSTAPSIASQVGPSSVTMPGLISHVSRTLASVSVCSLRPNFAGCATAISFFATGARRSLHGPDAIDLDLQRVRRCQDLRAERPGRLRVVEQLGQPFPCRATHEPLPARPRYGSDCTAAHRAPLPDTQWKGIYYRVTAGPGGQGDASRSGS